MIENWNPIQFLYRSIEYRDRCTESQLAGKPLQFQKLQYNNFSLQELFPLKRIELALDEKKKDNKKKNQPTWKVKLS